MYKILLLGKIVDSLSLPYTNLTNVIKTTNSLDDTLTKSVFWDKWIRQGYCFIELKKKQASK